MALDELERVIQTEERIIVELIDDKGASEYHKHTLDCCLHALDNFALLEAQAEEYFRDLKQNIACVAQNNRRQADPMRPINIST